MATAVKNARSSIAAGTTNTAGSTTTGSTITLTTALGGTAGGRITNGGTGPTLPANFVVQISHDNTNWREYMRQAAGTTASANYDLFCEIPPGILYARIVVDSNTGQSVTCEGIIDELTSVG